MDTSLFIQLGVVALIALMIFAVVRTLGRPPSTKSGRRAGSAAFVVLAGFFGSQVADPAEQAKVTQVREHDGEGPDHPLQ